MAKDKLRAEWFWVDRWMTSSGYLLPMEARGLYREMLSQAWVRGGKLPADPGQIRAATACPEDVWERCWPIVEPFWDLGADGFLTNETQSEVLRESLKKAKFYHDRAKKAAAARWDASSNAPSSSRDASSMSQASPQAMHKQCPPSPSPSPDMDKAQSRKKSVPKKVPPAVAAPSRVSSNRLVAAYQQAWKTRYGSLPAGVDYRKLAGQLKRIKATKEASDEEMAQSFLRFASDEDEWVIGCKHSVGAYTARVDSYFGLNHVATAPQTNLGKAVAYTRKLMEEEKNGNPH